MYFLFKSIKADSRSFNPREDHDHETINCDMWSMWSMWHGTAWDMTPMFRNIIVILPQQMFQRMMLLEYLYIAYVGGKVQI